MNSPFKRVIRLAQKELREILRDRRTIITLIAMPLLLYPLMTIAFQQFYLASRLTPEAGLPHPIFFLTESERRVFEHRLSQGQAALTKRAEKGGAAGGQKKTPTFPKLELFITKLEPRNGANRTES